MISRGVPPGRLPSSLAFGLSPPQHSGLRLAVEAGDGGAQVLCAEERLGRARMALAARNAAKLTSRTASLEIRALDGDPAVAEREQIAAVDLDLSAVGAGASEDPLRDAAGAGDHVAHVDEANV